MPGLPNRRQQLRPRGEPQALQQRVRENTVRSMERRLPGWSQPIGVSVPPR